MVRNASKIGTVLCLFLLLGAVGGSPGSAVAEPSAAVRPLHLPWKDAGLSPREAAAHLLDRFGYGPRPGEVDRVVAMGLDRWLAGQLAGNLPDPEVKTLLARLPAWGMTAEEIARTYPSRNRIRAEARRAGVIEAKTEKGVETDPVDPEAMRRRLAAFAEERGYLPERDLVKQLLAQKLARAALSENQLAEVMADFWFNHFNVSLTDNQARGYLLTYERDAIRPHALGRFRPLLEATAKHPAMLLYLDNAQSTAAPGSLTTRDSERERRGEESRSGRRGKIAAPPPAGAATAAVARKGAKGLNENYARELLELHTLGVDGGYGQQDVVEVARAFTGWTRMPARETEAAERLLARVDRAGGLGFVHDGEFLFRADQHDAGAKTVLGRSLPAGRGLEDGEAVLDLVATHPATARHLARKLAVRFVSDQPPTALVDRLARVFTDSGGDVRQMLAAIAESPEFWRRATLGAKIKSPFELAASALRVTGARLTDPKASLDWIRRMGQPLYGYQAPTGFPDRAETWVNTGSLLNRMSFGLQLAASRVRGVELDLAALDGGREPESRDAALAAYSALLLPGRDAAALFERLKPLLADPALARKVDEAAAPSGTAGMPGGGVGAAPGKGAKPAKSGRLRSAAAPHPPTPLEQVVGVILGSPEFQRR
jgi:uncharacterized protein (DUF1800 family)